MGDSLFDEKNWAIGMSHMQVVEGVTAILTPGHTYGLQGVLVEGKQSIFIVNDTLPLFKNLEAKPFALSNIFVDQAMYAESMSRIANLSAVILPNHDFGVLKKRFY